MTGGGSAYRFTPANPQTSAVDVERKHRRYGGDDFDQWSNSRDQRWNDSTSARYVSDDAVGYEDLDEMAVGFRS